MAGQQHRYEVLTHTGPGTPMGELMRQYWVPAIMSSELIADGDPVRIKLLGEELIGFRTTSGKVGVMDQRCPHRVASLFYGRNEEDGIRCVYHGWKFDADGKCVDQGNIPVEQQFCERTPAKAYPTMERAGVVFAYMGHAQTLPKLPPLPVFKSDEPVNVQCVMVECSWLQRMEGDIDTSHAGFLHAENRDKIASLDAANNPTLLVVLNPRPNFKAEDTEYGTIYSGWRPFDDKEDYHRIGQYMFPFYSIPAAAPLGTLTVNMAVPMDDEHHMRYNVTNKDYFFRRQASGSLVAQALGLNMVERNVPRYLPTTTDWYGRWRITQNPRNDHEMDRDLQRHGGSYTGIKGVGPQDQGICESMGAIPSYSFENLAPSDIMLVKTRNRILGVLQDVEQGKTPPGIENPEIYRGVTGGFANLPNNKDWLAGYADYTKHTIRPPQSVAAE